MRVPQWLTIGVAVLVIVFGLYRMKMASRSKDAEQRAVQKKGMWGLPRRTHALIGIIYLLLGGSLLATSFGWNPLGGVFGPKAPPTAPVDPGAVHLEKPGAPPAR
jgi:multisubunit Na+/H+ antiporter MnhB subunit